MTRYEEFPFPGLPSIHELTDASNECRHGRLPFDPGPKCGCWNIGWSPVKAVTVKPKRRQHPEFVRAKAVRLYRSGKSIRHVAMLFGVGRSTVRAWLEDAGVEVRSKRAA